MNFGQTIEALKQGKKVARRGWNGKGMFLLFMPAKAWDIRRTRESRIAERGNDISTGEFDMGKPKLAPFIGMHTATGEFVPWLASQTDMLAEDWHIVD